MKVQERRDIQRPERVRMWFIGLILPLFPVLYGIKGVIEKKTILPGRGRILELTGTDAVLMSCAYICVGLLMHSHYFWASHPKLWRFSDALKAVSLIGFLILFGIVVIRIISG